MYGSVHMCVQVPMEARGGCQIRTQVLMLCPLSNLPSPITTTSDISGVPLCMGPLLWDALCLLLFPVKADTMAVAFTNTSVHSRSLAWGWYPAND